MSSSFSRKSSSGIKLKASPLPFLTSGTRLRAGTRFSIKIRKGHGKKLTSRPGSEIQVSCERALSQRLFPRTERRNHVRAALADFIRTLVKGNLNIARLKHVCLICRILSHKRNRMITLLLS